MTRYRLPHNTPITYSLSTRLNLHSEPVREPVSFTAGRGYDPGYLAGKPAVLVPIFGMTQSDAAELFHMVYQAQAMSMGFRPILFTDLDVFSLSRPYGWLIEHHMSEYDHCSLHCDYDWEKSVIQHAQLIVNNFRVSRIVTPDPVDRFTTVLRQLRDVSAVEFSRELLQTRSETTLVDGWREWLPRPTLLSREFGVVSRSAGTIRVNVEYGSGDNMLIMDGKKAQVNAEPLAREARTRAWPIVETDTLEELDDTELRIAIASVLSLGDPDGTAVLACSYRLAHRIRSVAFDERIMLWEATNESFADSTPPMADIELMTTIRRASSALVQQF